MKTIAIYSGRASVTGKALRQKLRAIRKQTDKKAKCDLFLRWGSTEEFTRLRFRKELNTLDAVRRTTDKLEMLRVLSAAGIPVPQFNNDPALLDQHKDRSGNFYIRNKRGVVRYGNDFNPATDLYYSKPVQFKRREYRVHVFNGKVIGIYEKVPHDPTPENRPKLFKSDTCSFVRCSLEISQGDGQGLAVRVDQAARQLCINAVAALGLVFGGVDLIRNKRGEFTITEVNSAPGLNSVMVDKYAEEIRRYYADSTLGNNPAPSN